MENTLVDWIGIIFLAQLFTIFWVGCLGMCIGRIEKRLKQPKKEKADD